MWLSYYSTAVSERAILSAQALSIWVTPVMRAPGRAAGLFVDDDAGAVAGEVPEELSL